MWEDLVCPIDQGSLAGDGDWLACRRCGRGCPVLDGVPAFLSCDDDPYWLRAINHQAARLPLEPPDDWSARSNALRTAARQLECALAPHVNLQPHSKILQVGLQGEGEIHHLRVGVRYAIDPLACLMAQRGLLRWGRVRWVAGRGEELPFPDRNFQLILLNDVLDRVESPLRVLQEAYRCLADDGVLWISTPVAPAAVVSAWNRIVRRRRALAGPDAPLRRFTTGQLGRVCRRAQFDQLWAFQTHMASGPQGLPQAEHTHWFAGFRAGRRDVILRPAGRAARRRPRATPLASPETQRAV